MDEVVFIVKKRGGGERRLMRSPWKISKVEPEMVLVERDELCGRPKQGCEA